MEQLTANAGGVAGKRGPSFIVGGDTNWYSQYRNQHGKFSKLKIKLPCDMTIRFLGICPKHLTSYSRDTCSTMSIAALVTIARKWK